MSVTYLAAARGSDVTASARVLRRGKNLCFVDVEARTNDGTAAARGLVIYKIG